MSAVRKYHLNPIFVTDTMLLPIPSLFLSEVQLNIIRLLAQKGDCSVFDLSKAKYLSLNELEAEIYPFESEELEKSKREKLYHYAQIHRSVEELEKLGLVKTRMDMSGVHPRRIAGLTFTGVILYLSAFRLETKFERTKAKRVVGIYSDFLPFSAEWDSISKIVGKEEAFDRLRETASSFAFIQRVTFELRRQNLKFEGFLRTPMIGAMSIPRPGTMSRRDRNQEFSEFLATRDQLLKAYIAYLAVYDIAFLSYLDPGEIKKWIDKLWSEKELAHLEERRIETNSLFSGERLREFFPRCATLNSFFTGMFMEHLLWRTFETETLPYPDKITLDY